MDELQPYIITALAIALYFIGVTSGYRQGKRDAEAIRDTEWDCNGE